MYQFLARAVFGTQEKIRSSKISQSKSTRYLLVPVTAVPVILLVGFSGLQSAAMSTAAPETTTVPAKQAAQTPIRQLPPDVAALQPTTQILTAASPTTKTTQRVYLAGKRVSFVPPAGFTAMTAEEIALKFPRRGANTPQHVYANERRSVAVAITFSQAQVSPEQLPELKNFLQKFIERAMPNIKWITQNFAVINNVRWVQLEFISRAIDTDIHNDAYFTSFDGKMLGFNFNSTVEQYDALSAELRKSRDSITISQ